MRKWWGWGYEEDGIDAREVEAILAGLGRALGGHLPEERIEPVTVDEVPLRAPRFSLPAELAPFATDQPRERLAHAYGQAYVDVIRAVRGDVPNPPDYVAFPTSDDEIGTLLRVCERERIAVAPYGGGTSVVGGVEPTGSSVLRGSITLDLARLDRVLEVDERSRLVHVQAGALGPAFEAALKPHGLTLRHFPQSFEFSSVGGWIATRAAGHYATGPTHIDELVAGVRMLSPRGAIEVVPRAYAGGGPAPERLILGSEGILGVITDAWLRVHPIPGHRVGRTIGFEDPGAGIEAVRSIVQAGLEPANCRLISPLESALTGLGDGRAAILLLGFESADHPVDALLDRALQICTERGGFDLETPGDPPARSSGAAGGAERWRGWFLRAPYLRDRLVLRGVIVETFETATSWTSFERLHEGILTAVLDSARRECGRGIVTWRLTYAYPDGVAPYYTVVAPGSAGREVEQWSAIKAAASDAIEAGGGTATHHHAVGRTHAPWYGRERGTVFLDALRAAKQVLDPAGIMNPGVLLDEA